MRTRDPSRLDTASRRFDPSSGDDAVTVTVAGDRVVSHGDAYETVRGENKAVPDGDAAPPEVHQQLDKFDVAELRAYLEAHPDEIGTLNAAGDTLLHVAALKGAVMLAELLDELGASATAPDKKGLFAGHRAAEKHPRTARFLFERAASAEPKEASWATPTAVAKAIAKAKPDTDAKIDRLAAKLCGVTVTSLNTAREVVKNRTHLEAVKGTVLDLKAEGWWQAQFGPQRVRSLLSAIAEIDDKTPPGTKEALIREVSTQLDLIRTIRRVRATSKCPSAEIRRQAMNLEARLVTPRILASEHETALALGWKNHAIYGGFVKVPADEKAGHDEPTLLVRIDNRGSGAKLAHDNEEQGEVRSRAFHIPMSWLETPKGARAFERFVADLLLVKATPDSNADMFYAHVADFKRVLKQDTEAQALIESPHGVPPDASLPPQIAGNCVVANTFPGLSARLGTEIYAWFTEYERELARELVDEYADPNTLIDEECRERDERQIEKILDSDGPWAERLATLTAAAKYPGAKSIGSDVTIEQLTTVIEAGDHEALAVLLDHGASKEMQDDRDRTPLHLAAKAGQTECVAVLLERKANVHAMDADGNTPLHLAITAHSHPSVAALLSAGADRNRANKAKVTPRDLIDEQLDSAMLIAKTIDGGDVVPMDRKRRRPFAPTGT